MARPGLTFWWILSAASCGRDTPERPRELVGLWVRSDTQSLAIEAADTAIGVKADPGEVLSKTLKREAYRDDSTHGRDTLFTLDSLRLQRDGSAQRWQIMFQRGAHGVKFWDGTEFRWRVGSTIPPGEMIEYSSWTLTIDSATNKGQLCLDIKGYRGRDCGRLVLDDGGFSVSWRSQGGAYLWYSRIP